MTQGLTGWSEGLDVALSGSSYQSFGIARGFAWSLALGLRLAEVAQAGPDTWLSKMKNLFSYHPLLFSFVVVPFILCACMFVCYGSVDGASFCVCVFVLFPFLCFLH